MRIGMVTACYKPVINGVTRMISLYKQSLEELGHEVTIFTLGEPDPAGEEPGVVRSPAVALGDNGYYVTARYTNQAQDLLQEMDIIHCHHLFMSVELAHRYGRCPIVYTNHTRYDLYTGAYIPLPQPAADAIMRQVWPDFTDLADVVITPSDSVREVMTNFGVRKPIEVIENGVALEPFRTPSNPMTKQALGLPESAILVIYVGRLSPEKNLSTLLDQFAVAQEMVPELHLMLVGHGPSSNLLVKQAHDLGVGSQVHLSGPIDYESITNYLAAADIFATASVTEVHPLTIIEAMASGLPIAAVSSPGIVDTVESGKTGFLTRYPESGLATAMVALALNKELRLQMGVNAQIASSRFDIRETAKRTVALYERLQETRPDLLRKREHGRWARNRDRLQPIVQQLDRLLPPADKPGSGSRKWFSSDLFDLDGPDGE